MAAIAWLPDPQKEVFAEDEVTTSSLTQILQQALYKVSPLNDTHFIVDPDGVIVSVNQDIKMIRFIAMWDFKESAALKLKHATVNKLNDEVRLVRFSISQSQPDLVYADYYLTFENGILPFQVVHALRLFSRIATYAIQTCDEKGLLK